MQNYFTGSNKVCKYYLLESSMVQFSCKSLNQAAGKYVTNGRNKASPLGATRLSQGQNHQILE